MPKDSWLLKMRYNCPISLNLGTSEWVEKEGQAFQHWLWGLTYNNGWHSIFLVGQHENWGGEGFQKVLILCVFSHKPTKCLNYGGKRDSVMKSVLTVKQKSVCICANPPPPNQEKNADLTKRFQNPKRHKKPKDAFKMKNAWHTFEKFALNAFLTDWAAGLKMFTQLSLSWFLMHLNCCGLFASSQHCVVEKHCFLKKI